MTKRRTWRLEPKRRSGGTYWLLLAGRNDDRVRLALGYLERPDAERARESMQREEDAGRAARVLELHQRDAEAAVQTLVGHPGLAALLPPAKVDHARMTLREYFDTVFRVARSAAKPKSWRTEAGRWKRLLEGLGDHRLEEIDARVFLRWVRDLQVGLAGGSPSRRAAAPLRPASGQYKAGMRMALQACLTHAYLEGHVERLVKLGEVRMQGSTTRARVKPDPLSLDELRRLLEASDGKHRAMWAVGCGQGLRPSELVRLRWEDVRWTTRTLVLRGDEQGRGKTAASVDEIPLTPLAHRELRAWWMAQAQPSMGLVFAGSGGKIQRKKRGEPAKPKPYTSSYRRALAAAAKAAGIERVVYPYLLRDSFATLAYLFGIDKEVTRRIGRWTDSKMLDEVYCRPRPADLVAKLAAFDVG